MCAVPGYLCVAVEQRHQGGVDDLPVGVGQLALPASDWLLGVDPVVQLVSAPAPQHHLQTQNTHISPDASAEFVQTEKRRKL